MKKKASPGDTSVLLSAACRAGRKAVLKSLYAGLTVCGMEDGVIVGRDSSNHPMTMHLEKGAKLEDHPESSG